MTTAELLDVPPIDRGPLLGVRAAAAAIGVAISDRTGLRWGINGRYGLRLPTRKAGGRRLTTVAALRQWLADIQAAEDRSLGRVTPPITIGGANADAVLAAHGLGREGGR